MTVRVRKILFLGLACRGGRRLRMSSCQFLFFKMSLFRSEMSRNEGRKQEATFLRPLLTPLFFLFFALGQAGPCAVCQEDYQSEDVVHRLSNDPAECSHVFHRHCIIPWLRQVTSPLYIQLPPSTLSVIRKHGGSGSTTFLSSGVIRQDRGRRCSLLSAISPYSSACLLSFLSLSFRTRT